MKNTGGKIFHLWKWRKWRYLPSFFDNMGFKGNLLFFYFTESRYEIILLVCEMGMKKISHKTQISLVRNTACSHTVEESLECSYAQELHACMYTHIAACFSDVCDFVWSCYTYIITYTCLCWHAWFRSFIYVCTCWFVFLCVHVWVTVCAFVPVHSDVCIRVCVRMQGINGRFF